MRRRATRAQAGEARHLAFEYPDKVGSWHGFMAATALAWWHGKLTRNSAPWRELIEPAPDAIAKWPEPILPAAVAASATSERVILPPAVLAAAGSPARAVHVLAADMPPKPDDADSTRARTSVRCASPSSCRPTCRRRTRARPTPRRMSWWPP